jgi:hypothetical protein
MPRGYSGMLLENVSALNTAGTVGPNEVGGARDINVTIEFGAGTSAGAVTVESAGSAGYGGTWAQEAAVNWAAAGRQHVVNIPGPRDAVRARIPTAIVGGTVNAKISVVN